MARRKTTFRQAHPFCCFCGGNVPATTIDHVPPKTCFPIGQHPDPMEFPACDSCNLGSAKLDQVAGFLTQMVDFSHAANDPEKHRAFANALIGVRNNKASALPDFSASIPISKIGNIYTPTPVAFQAKVTPAMNTAAQILFQKLTHALHYRHVGSILTSGSRYVTSSFQPQAAASDPWLNYMRGLPTEEKLGRKNLPKAPTRFGYRWGIKPAESLFMFAAQFGQGLIVWGITIDPAIAPLPTQGHLRASAWRVGGDVSTSIQTALSNW